MQIAAENVDPVETLLAGEFPEFGQKFFDGFTPQRAERVPPRAGEDAFQGDLHFLKCLNVFVREFECEQAGPGKRKPRIGKLTDDFFFDDGFRPDLRGGENEIGHENGLREKGFATVTAFAVEH